MKGSLTVEASCIFPFCFVVIAIICYLGIHQYNQAVLEMTGYECILQTMEERNEEESVFKENLLRRARQAAADRIVGVNDLKTSLNMTASKISLSYEGTQTIFDIAFKVTVVYERVYPELTLRFTDGITGE